MPNATIVCRDSQNMILLDPKKICYSGNNITLPLICKMPNAPFTQKERSEAMLNVPCYSYAESLCLSHRKRSESLIKGID